LTGELCFFVNVSSSLQNFSAAKLFFAVSNAYLTSYPVANNISLDSHGRASLLNASTVWGVWNFSIGGWGVSPLGNLPTASAFEIVFDSGLQSNASLVGSYFYVEHPSPDAGSLGIPL
jgi:hypothetical protein